MNLSSAFFLSAIFLFSAILATAQESEKNKYEVYIFMHESCKICQYYSPVINALHENYSNDSISWSGIFPNDYSKFEDRENFKTKHQLGFTLRKDSLQILTTKFNATVTPEVVIYNSTQDSILYQGRIDNGYVQIGKRRRVVTKQEFADALEAITRQQTIPVVSTDAIGCFIERY